MDARQVIIEPVVSEKSYALMTDGKYTFRVDDRAHKTQIARAVEEIFDVRVAARAHRQGALEAEAARACTAGATRSWKKAVVQLAPGDRIELFEGAAVASTTDGRSESQSQPRPGVASPPSSCATS